VLLESIAAIADQPVKLAAGDPRAESDNIHWLDASPAERSALSVAALVAALLATAHKLRERVAEPAVFYVWHDEQTAQLRCSVTTRPATDLPFGSDYRVTGDLAPIVAMFLTATPKAAVPWEVELTADDPAPRDDPPVPVWVFDLTP
jgi:hypothetical protein